MPPATPTNLGGVIVGNGLSVTSNGTLSVNTTSGGGLKQLGKILYERFNDNTIPITVEYWTANYDGTNQTKVPITLPSGLTLDEHANLSPDGQTIFFGVSDATKNYIYKSKLNGSGLTKIIETTTPFLLDLKGAY